MFDWLKRKAAPSSRLAGLLADYPAFTPPHMGANGAAPEPGEHVLSLAECRENLAAYLTAMPDRLALLRRTLGAIGVYVDRAYDRPHEFVAQLHATLLTELPPLYRPELRTGAAQEASTRDGPHVVLSFMADLALLEADVLMRAKPGCFLGLNLDPGDRNMSSWRRPCLLGLADRLFPNGSNVYHLEAEWFGRYASMDDPTRFATPSRASLECWDFVIGGTILQRLDRDIVDPDLDEKLRTTWLGQAQAV